MAILCGGSMPTPIPYLAACVLAVLPTSDDPLPIIGDVEVQPLAAATALGMTEGQILRQVRLPLASSVILAGVRTSAVLIVGTATLAAFIGAGGLGVPIVAGLQMADPTRILSGAIPAAGGRSRTSASSAR